VNDVLIVVPYDKFVNVLVVGKVKVGHGGTSMGHF